MGLLATKDYNPDEPRDDHGRWSGGGGSNVIPDLPRRQWTPRAENVDSQGHYHVFHGTTPERAVQIRKDGLKPPSGQGPGWQMVTTSRAQAARYGEGYGSASVVLEYAMPVEDAQRYLTRPQGHDVYGASADSHGLRAGILPSQYLMAKAAQMQHMLLKATMTAADEGIFEAIISAPTIDREKDIVDPSAMVAALQKWTPTGKNIPLAWNHSSQSADQIGYVDPSSARVVGDEVAVSGWIDQATPVGADAWRLVKMGTLGFSFGYLIPDGGATPRKGGGLHITELDVFEVTATPTPMNNDTRVLGFKADVDEDTSKALQRHAESLAAEVVTEGVDLKAAPAEPESENDLEQELQDVKAALARMVTSLEDLKAKVDTPDPGVLRRQAETLALEVLTDGESVNIAPVQPEPENDLELQEVKAQLAQVRETLEDLTKKAGESERDSRSMDPLRAKTDALALEIASDGESLLKPPQNKTRPPEPGMTLTDMRDWWYANTLETLSEDLKP